MPLCMKSSDFQLRNVIERPVPDHGEQDRETSVSQRDKRLVVAFALGPFPVIAFLASWIETDGCKRRKEQRSFQAFVP